MDSARKRKASNATPNTTEGSAPSGSKRIKLLNSAAPPSNESAVQKVGFKLLAQLSNATDKTGRPITDAFQELPDRDEYEDYYRTTKLPLAISTIEDKLKRGAYPTVTTLESDLKRMVQNAKDYNLPKSDIFEDAERIRKLVYNFMKVNNPEYRTNPNYSSFSTPLPTTTLPTLHLTNGNRDSGAVKHEPQSREVSAKPRQSTAARASEPRQTSAPKVSEPPSERKSSIAPSAGAGGEANEEEELDFTGKSFQEAQEMLIQNMIDHKNTEGLVIFTPFALLPSRKLEDYYHAIKHPVSLKGVQKRVRGIHGREPPTGRTDFKNWDAFEHEVSFIWRNARVYNEDGSEMYELANEFEEYFKMRLKEAKEKVEDPVKPSIKIGGPKPQAKSGFTLNLNHHRSSPTPGVTVDNEALARQRQMVQAGVNGHQTQQPLTQTANGAVRPPSQTPNELPRPSSSTHAASPPAYGVKNEKYSTLSPAPVSAAQPTMNGMMPPPMVRPPSGSPYPYAQTNGVPYTSYHYTAPALLPPTQTRSYPASQALLPVVTISTDPRLKTSKPYSLAIPPHPSLSHQSTTITLPSSHYYLQIAPTISRELSMGRPYKMFVTVNGTRLTQRDTQFHADSGQRTHVYEGSLASGVNRIEVEVAAAKLGGDSESKGLDIEKVTVFANLSRMSK